MAGINRLGNAPPKPGTFRPPDPNRFKSVDMYAENTEGDIEYQRMVKDIEEMQQRQGWLTGRGAFDKADLLYLRDTAEQQRHMEMEQRDTETAEFTAMRARIEREAELEARLPLNRSSSLQKQGSGDKDKPKSGKPWVPVVKVKAAKKGPGNGTGSEGSASKRQRVSSDLQGKVPVQANLGAAAAAAAGEPSLPGSVQAAAAGPSDIATVAAEALHNQDKQGCNSDSQDGEVGLGGLLGGYGSDSDSDGELDMERPHQGGTAVGAVAAAAGDDTATSPGAMDGLEAKHQQAPGQDALPSALDVLGGEIPDTLARPAVIENEGDDGVYSMSGGPRVQMPSPAVMQYHEGIQSLDGGGDDQSRQGARHRGWV